jgi:hypothetical protein
MAHAGAVARRAKARQYTTITEMPMLTMFFLGWLAVAVGLYRFFFG